MTSDKISKLLSQGVLQLNLNLSEEQLNQLLELQAQLMKWTRAFNLTAITDEVEVCRLHLLDSLAIAPFWHFQKSLDVGTGAGFPGLPLAIALPDREFHLLDSNSKKIRFIRQQIHHLGLTNVVAHHSRVQQHTIFDYDCIVSRAFASLSDMVEMTQPLLAKSGSWMAMKGIYSAEDIAQLPNWVKELRSHNLTVPGVNAERCLIELVRRND